MSGSLDVVNNNWEIYPEEQDILLQTLGTYMDKNVKVKGIDTSKFELNSNKVSDPTENPWEDATDDQKMELYPSILGLETYFSLQLSEYTASEIDQLFDSI